MRNYYVVENFETLVALSKKYPKTKKTLDNFKRTKVYKENKDISLLERFCQYLDQTASREMGFKDTTLQTIFNKFNVLPISTENEKELYFEGSGIPTKATYQKLILENGKLTTSEAMNEPKIKA